MYSCILYCTWNSINSTLYWQLTLYIVSHPTLKGEVANFSRSQILFLIYLSSKATISKIWFIPYINTRILMIICSEVKLAKANCEQPPRFAASTFITIFYSIFHTISAWVTPKTQYIKSSILFFTFFCKYPHIEYLVLPRLNATKNTIK